MTHSSYVNATRRLVSKACPALLLGLTAGAQELPIVEDQQLHMAARDENGKVILRMTAFHTGGGSLPSGYVVKPLGPSDIIDNPDQDGKGPVRADLTTIQHTYAASFDIDLAPFITDLPPRFDSDSFDPENNKFLKNIALRDVNQGINNSGGFRVEDHKYEIPAGTWIVGGVDLGYLLGFDKLDWPFYHGPETSPRLGDYYDDPGAWTGRDPITPPLLDLFRSTQRYLMTCNVGPQFLTGAIPDPRNVAAVGEALGAGVEQESVVAANGLGMRLITGPLASFWQAAALVPLRLSIEGPSIISVAEYAWKLLWPVSGGRTYRLEQSGDLINWTTVPENYVVEDGKASTQVRAPRQVGHAFYRVVEL